jgi:hypothetical protein
MKIKTKVTPAKALPKGQSKIVPKPKKIKEQKVKTVKESSRLELLKKAYRENL